VRSPGRVVPSLNALVAVSLVALVAAVAVVAEPPRPPGISEFAPRASKPITKAPDALGGVDPRCAAGRCSSPTPGTTPSSWTPPGPGAVVPRPRAEGVPSALSCIRWPDGSVTQTFDPQSPPCIASWEERQGNGGATARGVTGSTIKVAVMPSQIPGRVQWEAFAQFFNTRYQLYGRRIVLDFQGYSGASPLSASGQRATAQAVAASHAFAVTNYSENIAVQVFPLEVAGRGVVYAGSINQGFDTATDASRLAPFLWSHYAFFDERQRETADFLCASLARRPAALSGLAGADGSYPRRSFAVLRPTYKDSPSPSAAPVVDGLAACGEKVLVVDYDADRAEEGATSDYQATLTQIMLDLRQRGVTTLILQAGVNHYFPLLTSAQHAAYQPEWIRWGNCILDDSLRGYIPPEQMVHMFGPWQCDKDRGFTQTPAQQALRAMGVPGPAPQYGQDPSFALTWMYDSLALVAAGVQLAGPRLTPQAFGAGLHAVEFPNPGAGRAPFWQGRLGVQSDGFSLLRDSALVRWSGTERSAQDNRPGTWCYLNRGQRFSTAAGWPADDSGLVQGPTPCR